MINHKNKPNPTIVSEEVWLAARKKHLAKEKEFSHMRDQLSRERRELPWVAVEKEYIFNGPNRTWSLSDLFEDRSQLIVYHFMFGADWEEGCPICSFWADNFEGINTHLNQRDINLVAISKAPHQKLLAYKKRMDWSFRWVSSLENNFNYDYHVSFEPDKMQNGEKLYNYGTTSFAGKEAPGVSVFYKDRQGTIFHTYSCYARGLDMLNGTYHFIDLTPVGRDEDDLPHSMAWVRRHDQYNEQSS